MMIMAAVFLFSGIIICGGFAAIGFYLSKQIKDKLKICTEQTQGTVLDIVASEDNDRHQDGSVTSTTMYTPVFEYGTIKGVFREKLVPSSNNPDYKVGQSVQINYDPNNPSVAIVVGDKGDAFIAKICMWLGIGVGILFTVLGIVFLFIGI